MSHLSRIATGRATLQGRLQHRCITIRIDGPSLRAPRRSDAPGGLVSRGGSETLSAEAPRWISVRRDRAPRASFPTVRTCAALQTVQ